MYTIELSSWQLRQHYPGNDQASLANPWIPAIVPGSVHEALIAADRLQDPFVGMNESAAQWVGESDWMYRCTFDLDEAQFENSAIDLCFDGLDTIAHVYLNGVEILYSDNMFIPQRVAVRTLVKPGTNQLQIHFESALQIGKQREAEYGIKQVWNGDPSRVYVRKAQYHYGWDWGPVLMTAGPWRDVRVECYDARIAEIACPPAIAADLSHVSLPVSIHIEDYADRVPPLGAQHAGHLLLAKLILHAPDGQLHSATSIVIQGESIEHCFEVEKPQLWWPNGYGEQARYRLEVILEQAQQHLDRRELLIGIRKLELLQEPILNEQGSSFVFQINNMPIFCGGANWIPADSFVTRITQERYHELIKQAAQANMVMLRVWGGGIYEHEAFYEACSSLGLLVWQDFMFGCGIYPAKDWFQQSVHAEAEAQIRRLRHQACIALWCGNNEDYQIAYSEGFYDHRTQPDANSSFPARVIYEQLLPEICARLDPGRPYWPGSPFLGANPDDPSMGDRHTWEVWGRAAEDYHCYPKLGGRFVSEFGLAAYPAMPTITAFTPEAERYVGSQTLEFHNKATGGARRLAAYQTDNLRPVASLDAMIYATQFVQAEALGLAYRRWRRHWAGPGQYRIAGTLVWQLDDCWPVISWSIIDYYGRTKPAYYAIRRALAPITLNIGYEQEQAAVWAVNGTQAELSGKLELRTWTLQGELISIENAEVLLKANRSAELISFPFEHHGTLVLDARFRVDGKVIARAALWPEPYKYMRLFDPLIVMGLDGSDKVILRVIRPAKGVWLSAGDNVTWSDNMLDLMPDDEQIISAKGLGSELIQLRWLQE